MKLCSVEIAAPRALFSLFFSGFLASCGGGGGGGSITLTTDEQGADPVVVEVPVAYIRRPLMDTVPDLRDPLAFNPGAELFVRDRSATSAEDVDVTAKIAELVALEEGVDAAAIALDIKGLESSYDGGTLIFAARAVPEPVDANLENTTWNLWTYDISERVARYLIESRIRRNEGVEAGGGHDIAPHFLPDDRIVFSSTRQVASQARLLNEGRSQLFAAITESGSGPAAVLHTYDPLLRGDEFRQISFNLSHDLDPVVLSSGEIVFSRWNNTATNHISLYRIDPSGQQLSPLFGFHSEDGGTPGGSAVYSQPRELDDGRLAALLRPAAAATLGGNIVIVDAAGFADVDQPNWGQSGATGSGQEGLSTREVRADALLSRGGQFGSVYALRDGTGRLLVTWSDCRVIDGDTAGEEMERFLPCRLQPDNETPAPPLYGGWIYDPGEDTQRPVVIPREGFVVSELVAAEPRDFPDVRPLTADHSPELVAVGRALLRIQSVYDVDGVDASPLGIAQHARPGSPAHAARPARFLRLYQPVPIPDPEVFEIPGFAAGVAGGRNFREILGYVPVEPDGSVSAVVPAERPFSFDVLDSRGRRIGQRHDYWLQLGAGETLRCTGCHDRGTRLPHGRIDAQPPSSNPGARSVAGGGLGFPGTDTAALFATEAGHSMADTWDFHRPSNNPAAADRPLTIAPSYLDEWHDPQLPPEAPVDDRDYSAAFPDIPPERAIVVNSFDPDQPARIVINYIDHVQPIWERVRDPRLDSEGRPVDTCTGCHASIDGATVPAGQLDLSATPSTDEPEHLVSYRQLLLASNERWLDGAGAVADRERICTVLDDEGNAVTTVETISLAAPMRGGSANASARFFACFEGGSCGTPEPPPLPADCVEGDGEIAAPTRDTVDHAGLLSEPELHLLSEWLDIGAQYYNNPFDARLAE